MKINKNFTQKKYLILKLVLTLFIFLGALTNTSKELTESDEWTLNQMGFAKNSKEKKYEDQIEQIKFVQKKLLDFATNEIPIPLNSPREPIDFVVHRSQICYDKTRVLEKAYQYIGYKVRHVYILVYEDSLLKTLITRRKRSHAAVEVYTSKGWLLVDSTTQFIAINNNNPYSIKKLKNVPEIILPEVMLNKSLIPIYGLYSVNGKMYPPYVNFPNINYIDFVLQNLNSI